MSLHQEHVAAYRELVSKLDRVVELSFVKETAEVGRVSDLDIMAEPSTESEEVLFGDSESGRYEKIIAEQKRKIAQRNWAEEQKLAGRSDYDVAELEQSRNEASAKLAVVKQEVAELIKEVAVEDFDSQGLADIVRRAGAAEEPVSEEVKEAKEELLRLRVRTAVLSEFITAIVMSGGVSEDEEMQRIVEFCSLESTLETTEAEESE